MSSHLEDKPTLNQEQIKPQEISPSYFTGLFEYMGTVENSAFFCIQAALDFRQMVCGGDEAIWHYIQYTAQTGADLIAQSLGTEVMGGINQEGAKQESTGADGMQLADIRQCAMANIRLPFAIADSENAAPTSSSTPPAPPRSTDLASANSDFKPVPTALEDLVAHASWLQSTLIKEYRIGVTVYPYASRIWLRVSGQIYLELSDFEKLAEVVKVALERVRHGESLSKK